MKELGLGQISMWGGNAMVGEVSGKKVVINKKMVGKNKIIDDQPTLVQ